MTVRSESRWSSRNGWSRNLGQGEPSTMGKIHRSDRVDGATSARAFRADGSNGCRVHAGGPTVQSTRNLLGADHYSGDHPVIAWFDTCYFLAPLHWNGAWSGSWRDWSKLLRFGSARIRRQRVPSRNTVHRRASGSDRFS